MSVSGSRALEGEIGENFGGLGGPQNYWDFVGGPSYRKVERP